MFVGSNLFILYFPSPVKFQARTTLVPGSVQAREGMLNPKVMMFHLTVSCQQPLNILLSSPFANFTIGITGGLHRQPTHFKAQLMRRKCTPHSSTHWSIGKSIWLSIHPSIYPSFCKPNKENVGFIKLPIFALR